MFFQDVEEIHEIIQAVADRKDMQIEDKVCNGDTVGVSSQECIMSMRNKVGNSLRVFLCSLTENFKFSTANGVGG